MRNNARNACERPGESRGVPAPEKSPVFKDDQYIYALCKDVSTGAYGIAMQGLDSRCLYDNHSYYPEEWGNYSKAVSNFRNLAFKLGLRLLKKQGRVVFRYPETDAGFRADLHRPTDVGEIHIRGGENV